MRIKRFSSHRAQSGLGLRGQLKRWVRFHQRNNTYSIGEGIEALLYHPLILGIGRVETTEPLRRNGVFQYLAGLPCYPQATTLRHFLRRLAQRGRPKLMALHDAWRHEMLRRPNPDAPGVNNLAERFHREEEHQLEPARASE